MRGVQAKYNGKWPFTVLAMCVEPGMFQVPQ